MKEKDQESLEKLVAQFVTHTGNAFNRMMQGIEVLQQEMLEFKDEVRRESVTLKNSVQHLAGEMKGFKDEMLGFRQEMLGFKDEIHLFKEDVLKLSQENAIALSIMANRLGTFADDVALPHLRHLVKHYFDCNTFEFFARRVLKQHRKDAKKLYEFSALAMSAEKMFLIEAKLIAKIEYIEPFTDACEELGEYFPEYTSKPIAALFCAPVFSPDIVDYLTKQRIYAVEVLPHEAKIINFDELKL